MTEVLLGVHPTIADTISIKNNRKNKVLTLEIVHPSLSEGF